VSNSEEVQSSEGNEEVHLVDVIEYYNKAVDKAIPVQKEINDIKGDIIKSVNNCIKDGFCRPPAEFTLVKNSLYDLQGLEEDIETAKIYKVFDKVKVLVEYLTFLGHEDIIQKINSKLGMETKLMFQPEDTLGNADTTNIKFNDNYVSLFADDVPEDKKLILENLVNVSSMVQKKLDDKIAFIKDDLGEAVRQNTRISKSTFQKGINFKIKSELNADVEDKIHDITESNLLENSAFESILYKEDEEDIEQQD
jgi:hypothetical protein